MQVKTIVPQLRTTDLDRAIRFYTETLGFSLAFRYQDFYAGIDTGGGRFHLKLIDDPDPGIAFVREEGHLHLHIEVEDVRRVFDHVRATEATIVEEVTARPWGTTEFVIEDADGHTLFFGQMTESKV